MTSYTTRKLGRIRTIALATDGTRIGAGAEREAIFLCRTWKARLVILHVITVDTEQATFAHSEAATLRREIKEYIERLKNEAISNGIECTAVIEESYTPDTTIVKLAEKHRADLIVMGRHERSGLMRFLAGSVFSKIIGLGFPKVLVVPKDSRINVERILLATDGSRFGNLATEEALDLGEHCPLLKQLIVLSVAGRESELQSARQRVEDTCRRIEAKNLSLECMPCALSGNPAEIITEMASRHKVGMIIMGGHGRELSRLLMGHVTEKVISLAPCAVLVVEK